MGFCGGDISCITDLCLLLCKFPSHFSDCFILGSWEKVQIKMLEKHVHENLKIGIHFYSTLLLDCGSLAGKVFAFVDHIIECEQSMFVVD